MFMQDWYTIETGWGTWDVKDLHVMCIIILVSMLCFPSDTSLTLPNVLAALRTVEDVEILGADVLHVPYTKREKVRRQSASVEEWREDLVKYFLHTNPNASWEWLLGQLLRYGEEAAVQDVKVHIETSEGGCVDVLLYLDVVCLVPAYTLVNKRMCLSCVAVRKHTLNRQICAYLFDHAHFVWPCHFHFVEQEGMLFFCSVVSSGTPWLN